MEVFEGYSINKGMVLASIAKARFDFGIPSLTSQRLRSIGERLMNEEEGFVEAEQVVLVADQFPTSLVASAIPGIEVVGVAVGGYVDEPTFAAIEALLPSSPGDRKRGKGDDSFPIVAGLGDAFVRDANEYEIVLIDGNAGRVFVAPDAFVVSRFQSSATRKRYFLEGAHVAAKTASDNRVVSVFCRAWGQFDIEAGMTAGADGIYMASANRILSEFAPLSAANQVTALHEMMDLTGGKPIVLDVPSTVLAYSALLETAAAAPLSIVVDTFAAAEELRAAIDVARNLCDPDTQLGDLSILIGLRAPGNIEPLPNNLDGIDGIVLPDEWQRYDIEHVIVLLGLARHADRPVFASLTEDWVDEIEDIVRFGVSGLIAPGVNAADVKDAIREL